MRAIAAAFALFVMIHAVVLLCPAASAAAGFPVELAPHPASRGPEIVLADLFEGVEGPAGTVVVGKGAAPGQSMVLDAGRVQLAAHQAGLEWDNARGLRRIIVEGGEADPPMVAAPQAARGRARSAAHARTVAANTVQVLVYARNIPAGDAVSAEDLTWAEAPATLHLADPLGDQEAAAGRLARRPLRAGAPAMIRDLVGAKVIHRDDVVAVIFRDDGMVLSLQGRALGDAAAGEPVQILNLGSKKTVEAVAAGPGRAVVGPEADALRITPSRSSAALYASVR